MQSGQVETGERENLARASTADQTDKPRLNSLKMTTTMLKLQTDFNSIILLSKTALLNT